MFFAKLYVIDIRFSNSIITAMEIAEKFFYIEKYHMLLSRAHTFFIEIGAEILPAHYTWKLAFTNHIHKQSVQVKL